MDAVAHRPRWALTVVCVLGSWLVTAAVAVVIAVTLTGVVGLNTP